MNRERFIRQRRGDWQQMEQLVNQLQGTRMGRWTGQQITELSRQYRSVCYDLSLVQSREWGSRLEQYLNDLVAQGHNCLYRSPPRSLDAVLEFLRGGFPRLLRERAAFFFVALALFAVPFLVSMTVAALDTVLAERLVHRTGLEKAGRLYAEELYEKHDTEFVQQRSEMFGLYVWNNIGIAFRSFALGVFLGIGTVLTLLFNGIHLGAVSGYLINRGHTDNFFSFAISHGSFELTAIVVAGAAGLLLGWGMIHPGTLSRRESLLVHGLDAVKLACGSGFMLAIAALTEAFFSPLVIPDTVKYVVGAGLWITVCMYLRFGGADLVSNELAPAATAGSPVG